MSHIYISKRVQELIQSYTHLLPTHFSDVKDYSYVVISSQEMTTFKTNKLVTLIIIEEDETIYNKNYNYIMNDPLKIISLIQILYCSPYQYFNNRKIDIKISNDIKSVSYYLLDDTQELIHYFKQHIPLITLMIICFYVLIGFICFASTMFQLNHLFTTMILLCSFSLLLLYSFLYLFFFVYLKITRLLLMTKILNKEFKFYCLSDEIEGIELWIF